MTARRLVATGEEAVADWEEAKPHMGDSANGYMVLTEKQGRG